MPQKIFIVDMETVKSRLLTLMCLINECATSEEEIVNYIYNGSEEGRSNY